MKPPLVIDGMYGIGDNLHQRALIRELMKTHDVWLKSCHYTLYHDLIDEGLKVTYKGTRLRAQARTATQERDLFHPGTPPSHAPTRKVWYNKPDIDQHGSILESILGELGHKVPEPDFSLPIKYEWYEAADRLLQRLQPTKPILILRQLVLRREWDGSKRNPLPQVYHKIYQEVRPHFWTLSIADLAPNLEWIEGPTLQTDAQIHDGSLTFGTMAALYARATLVLSPAGHGPVLAQATGTPCIAVYGGRECYRTTERAGAHLAPTLGIDPDRPCDCHSNAHNCDKRTTIAPALERVRGFLMQLNARPPRPPKTLIFATVYVDCPERQKQTSQWLQLHATLNPNADLLFVDSQSPLPILPEAELKTLEPYVPGRNAKRTRHNFPDNVGHLSRGGRDGWGRAFCFGLDAAVDGQYDYVVHLEGDLLFRLPTEPIIREMQRANTKAASVTVKGMKRDINTWVETALMFFETNFLLESNFTERYDWKRRRVAPTPEVVVRNLLGPNLWLAPWKVLRGDKNQISHQNVLSLNLDGITHCASDLWTYDRFLEAALTQHRRTQPPTPPPIPGPQYPAPRKLNLGCGDNKLSGWENHDEDVDIRKPLPWPDGTVDYLLIEHCMEHVTYHQAVHFLEEANRILRSGGTLRVTVPSLEQVAQCEDREYHQFIAKWGGEANRRGATRAIIFAHGHEQAWTASLMHWTLIHAGFVHPKQHAPKESDNPTLKGLEGHGRVIGEKFNRIESMTFEATKPGGGADVLNFPTKPRAALILGGAECHQEDLAKVQALCAKAGVEGTLFLVNDQIEAHAGPGVACTLHHQSLPTWLQQRARRGAPPPTQVWATRPAPHVTNVTSDWAGSSGLFATKIALAELNFDRVLLCGVPMTVEGRHFKRHAEWSACLTFRRGWENHLHHLVGRVKSFSGWTEQKLGNPTEEWLRGIPARLSA